MRGNEIRSFPNSFIVTYKICSGGESLVKTIKTVLCKIPVYSDIRKNEIMSHNLSLVLCHEDDLIRRHYCKFIELLISSDTRNSHKMVVIIL